MDRPHGIVPTNGAYCIEEFDTIKIEYHVISRLSITCISVNFRLS